MKAAKRKTKGPAVTVTYNPATGEKVAEYTNTDMRKCPEIMHRARSAQAEWAKLSFHKRAKHILRMRRYITEHADELALAVSRENGKSRTDALATHGLDEAIERAQLYRDAGADMVFVEALENEADMRRVCREIAGPVMASIIDGGRTPNLTVAQCQDIGYAVMTNALMPTYAYAAAMRELYAHFKANGSTKGFEDRLIPFDAFNEIVGLAAFRRREEDEMEFGRRIARRRRKPREAAE